MCRYLLLTTALLVTGAQSAEDRPPPSDEPADVSIEGAVSLEEIDQDRDGRLNADEARQDEELTTYFVVWDTDQNGQLDAEEIRTGRSEMADENNSTENSRREAGDIDYQANFSVIEFETTDTMSRLDSDGDGHIAPAEWAESGVPTPFRELDRNRDGLLDPAEVATVRSGTPGKDTPERTIEREDVDTWEEWEDNEQRAGNTDSERRLQMMSDDLGSGIQFTALDTDDNAMIDRLEAAGNTYVMAHFDEWDLDNNELLDPEEAAQARVELDMN